MTNIFVDSSFIVALLNREDVSFRAATRLLTRHENDNLYYDPLIRYESINVTLRKWGKTPAKKLADWFRQTSTISLDITPEIEANAIKLALSRFTQSGPNIFDFIHFSCMQYHQIQNVLTFDSHFSRFGFTVLK